MYNYRYKKVAQSLLGLSFMPARTLNDFFAGFFYGQIRVDLKVNMAKPRPTSLRHSKSYEVICSGYGKEVVIPVPPPDDRDLL
jgi:hypothetical protein